MPADVLASLLGCVAATLPKANPATDAPLAAALAHVAGLGAALIDAYDFEPRAWSDNVVVPYLEHLLGAADTSALCSAFFNKSRKEAKNPRVVAVDEDEGEDLCDCEFSLAYGGKILLNCARLHLKRGRRYGLCGPNGVGKSTLMRAISNGQLEGFPPADQLKTVYVEHDIQVSRATQTSERTVDRVTSPLACRCITSHPCLCSTPASAGRRRGLLSRRVRLLRHCTQGHGAL